MNIPCSPVKSIIKKPKENSPLKTFKFPMFPLQNLNFPLFVYDMQTRILPNYNVNELFFFSKNEEPVPVPKISPVKTSEPSLNLLGLGK